MMGCCFHGTSGIEHFKRIVRGNIDEPLWRDVFANLCIS